MTAPMLITTTRPRLFYGWWVAMASAFALFLGPIPITVFSFGVFLRPLVQEFHSGRGAVSFSRTLGSTILACGVPFAGWLVDRFGARRVILPTTFVSGLILLSAYLCSGGIWQLYLFHAALGLAISAVAPVSYCYVIAHWFDRNRGLALGVMMFGLGIGAVIMPSLAQYLIARFGWRMTFVLGGAGVLVITMPVLVLFLKDRPEPMGLLPDGGSDRSVPPPRLPAELGLSWREAWHDSTFWVLFCAFMLVAASVQGCFAHVAAIFADRGSTAQAAALATSLFGGGVLIGRTGSGYLLDRFFAPRVAAIIFGCAAAGIGVLRISASQEFAFVAAFLIGLGFGAEVDIMAYLTSRYFGLRSFGVIYGVTFAGFGLAGGLATYLMGAAFDATSSYALTLAVCCVATLIGAALMLRLGPYPYQPLRLEQTSPKLQAVPSEL